MTYTDIIKLNKALVAINAMEKDILGDVETLNISVSGFCVIINTLVDVVKFTSNQSCQTRDFIKTRENETYADYRMYSEVTASFIDILKILDNYNLNDFTVKEGDFDIKGFIKNIDFNMLPSDFILTLGSITSQEELLEDGIITYDHLEAMLKLFTAKKIEFMQDNDEYYNKHSRKKAVLYVKDSWYNKL